MDVVIRPLNRFEGAKLKAIRLESLTIDGHLFASSYSTEEALPHDYWDVRAAETAEQCAIGLFVDYNLSGISLVSRWQVDASGDTALFGSSYITLKYRGMGFAKLLYEKRLHWTTEKTAYKKAAVNYREGNEKSRALNVALGAIYSHKCPMEYGDGQIDIGHWYLIDLESIRKSKSI